MQIIQQIDQFIQTQYPLWYQQNGGNFITFVQAYYQWLEQEGNALYYSRNYYNIKDIDTTFDNFIIYFKEKYFQNIQLGTNSDIRMLIKHALDIYRSKGTQRSVELLFQLAYGENVDFYYPSTDLFKLSDGEWFNPQYLELSLSDNNIQLNQKEVFGTSSGAIAFIDNIVRRFTAGTLQDVAYISAIGGKFKAGEVIQPKDGSLNIKLCPILKGSLNDLDFGLLGTGLNYTVGDVIPVTSHTGNGALFLITNTTSESTVDFEFEDGGYGYTTAANLYVSEFNLTLSNLSIANVEPLFNSYWNFQEIIIEPLASLNYISANGVLQAGMSISTYDSGGNVAGTGTIIGITPTDDTSGQATVSVLSGNVGNTFFTPGNTIQANIAFANGYNDITATGDFVANATIVTLFLNNSNNSFLVNELVKQSNPDRNIAWGTGQVTFYNNVTNQLGLKMISGLFYEGSAITGLVSNASANVTNIQMKIGVDNVNNFFVGANQAYIFSSMITANCITAAAVEGELNVSLSNNLLYQENIQLNTDQIGPFLPTQVGAPIYNFPELPSGNLTFGTIGQLLSYANATIGKIANVFFLGAALTSPETPFIVIDQSQISETKTHDAVVTYNNASGAFPVGEIVTQGVTNARGLVLSTSNSTVLQLQRMSYSNNFIPTVNSSTQLFGTMTGFIANCVSVSFNFDSPVMGHNANIAVNYLVGNGVITDGNIVDSGFGYLSGETLTIGSNGASATANVDSYGTGSGFYRTKGGFLSDQKKLFDGDFYQNYSYEIISGVLLPKYQELVNDLTHVAGTKLFGRFVFKSQSNGDLTINPTNFRIGNQYGITLDQLINTHAFKHTQNAHSFIGSSIVQTQFMSGKRTINFARMLDAATTFIPYSKALVLTKTKITHPVHAVAMRPKYLFGIMRTAGANASHRYIEGKSFLRVSTYNANATHQSKVSHAPARAQPTMHANATFGFAWTPAQLPGALFFTATMGVTSNSTNKVTQWNDQGITGTTLTNGLSGAGVPTFTANGFNSVYPAIQFTANTQYLANSGLTPGLFTSYSVFALVHGVSQVENPGADNPGLISFQANGTTFDTVSPSFITALGSNGANYSGGGLSGNATVNAWLGTGSVAAPNTTTIPVTTPVLMGFTVDGISARMFLQGNSTAIAANNVFANALGSATASVLRIGTRWTSGTGITQGFTGNVAAICIVPNYVFTNNDWAMISRWSDENYGTAFSNGTFNEIQRVVTRQPLLSNVTVSVGSLKLPGLGRLATVNVSASAPLTQNVRFHGATSRVAVTSSNTANGWNPSMIANTLVFWNAANGVTANATGGVTGWLDTSGSGNNLNLSNATVNPGVTWSTNAFNGGYPGVKFSNTAAGAYLQLAGKLFINNAFTIWALVANTTQSGLTVTVDPALIDIVAPQGGTDGTAGGGIFAIGANATQGNTAFMMTESGSVYNIGPGTNSVATLPQNNALPALLGFTVNSSGNATGWYNGTSLNAVSNPGLDVFGNTTVNSNIFVGVRSTPGATQPFIGTVAAMGIVNSYSMNANDWSNLVGWATQTFGVALPNSGPTSLTGGILKQIQAVRPHTVIAVHTKKLTITATRVMNTLINHTVLKGINVIRLHTPTTLHLINKSVIKVETSTVFATHTSTNWNPTMLTGAAGFWTASNGVLLNANGNVGQWQDQTPTRTHLVNGITNGATSDASVKWSANSFGSGYPGINFSNAVANGFMTNTSFSMASNTSYSWWMLVDNSTVSGLQVTNDAAVFSLVGSGQSIDTNTAGFIIDVGQQASTGNLAWAAYQQGYYGISVGGVSLPPVVAQPASQPTLLTFQANGAGANHFSWSYNGLIMANNGTADTIGLSPNTLRVGARGNTSSPSGASGPYQGTIAALGVCVNYGLNANDVANLVNWASSEYNLQLANSNPAVPPTFGVSKTVNKYLIMPANAQFSGTYSANVGGITSNGNI